MPIDYAEVKRLAWEENTRHIDLHTPSTLLKVRNWAMLRGIGLDDLLSDIECSKYFKLAFVKDPNRQNIYEKAAFEFLCGIALLKNVVKLPSSGERALFVSNGILTPGENVPRTRREERKSKSIDFKFIVKPCGRRKVDLICYAMHKYTEAEGGAQDNQCADLQLFLENCPIKRQECFIVFADGDYYISRVAEMIEMFDIPTKRRVLTLNEFESRVLNGEVI